LGKSVPHRLWILTAEYEPNIVGGLGTATTNLAKALSRSGVHVTVLSNNHLPLLKISGNRKLRVIRLPIGPRNSNTLDKVERRLKVQGYRRPQGVHIHSVSFTFLARQIRNRFRIPLIYTCHSLIALEKTAKTNQRSKMLRRQVQLMKAADRIVVPSHWELSVMKKVYPLLAKKTVVIGHGVTSHPARSRGPLHHLLFVGRLVSSKGIEQLLEAVAILKRKNKKVKLTIIGKGKQRYVNRLKFLCKKWGIHANVNFLGFRKPDQVKKMYASYGAVIMPSTLESFGLVALEAMASGVPLAATRSGGLAEIVNGKVAQVIPRVEGKAIAAAIEKMWNNTSLTNRRVKAGRRLASRYQWPRVANQYKKLFQAIQ
jgi:glycogen synthase